MHHLEVRELRLVSRLGEGVESCLHERRDPAAQHCLLAEEVGLGLFRKRGLEHAGARAADASRIRQRARTRTAGRVLVHREQTGDALTRGEGAAHQMPWSLRRHHAHVDACGRVDQLVADVEAVREHQHLARMQVRCDRLVVQRALPGVRRQHHDDVGFLARLGWRHDAQPLGFGCGAALARLEEPDAHVVSRVTQVQRVGMALRAVPQDRDWPARQRLGIGVCVVVHPSGH